MRRVLYRSIGAIAAVVYRLGCSLFSLSDRFDDSPEDPEVEERWNKTVAEMWSTAVTPTTTVPGATVTWTASRYPWSDG